MPRGVHWLAMRASNEGARGACILRMMPMLP